MVKSFHGLKVQKNKQKNPKKTEERTAETMCSEYEYIKQHVSAGKRDNKSQQKW